MNVLGRQWGSGIQDTGEKMGEASRERA